MVEGSGKFGGNVAMKGKSGPSVRTKTKGVNPRTNSQISRRAALSARSQAWRGLTAAQRDAWNAAAASGAFAQKSRLGRSYNPSGAQLYGKLNLNIVLMGGTAITDPPTKPSLTQILLSGLTAADATPALSLTYTGTLGTNENLLIYATGNLSPGITRPGDSQYRFIVADSGTSPIDLLSDYQAVFGDPVESQKIFVRALVGNDLSGVTAQAGGVSAIVAT